MSIDEFNIVFPKAGRPQSVSDSFNGGDSYCDSPRSHANDDEAQQ
jgi:hypothetical protein